MAITGVSKIERWDYFSKFDEATGDEAKTKWVLGAIDVDVRTYLGDITILHIENVDGKRAVMDRSGLRNLEAVRFGLKEVHNFKDPDGNDIKLEFVDRMLGDNLYKVLDNVTLSRIPPMVVGELGQEIMSKNVLSEQLRKKLQTP